MDNPYEVGDTVKMLMFPDLSHTESSEATLVARRGETALYSSVLATFSDTTPLLQK